MILEVLQNCALDEEVQGETTHSTSCIGKGLAPGKSWGTCEASTGKAGMMKGWTVCIHLLCQLEEGLQGQRCVQLPTWT